jgi:hypothetical protein
MSSHGYGNASSPPLDMIRSASIGRVASACRIRVASKSLMLGVWDRSSNARACMRIVLSFIPFVSNANDDQGSLGTLLLIRDFGVQAGSVRYESAPGIKNLPP